MKDQLIPWELEVKLISLGFDRNKRVYLCDGRDNKEEGITGILWQQSFNFFRDKYGLFGRLSFNNKEDYLFDIMKIAFDLTKGEVKLIYGSNYYKTYEEAREACLIKLIELCQK